jgi:hypothetical protein
MKPPENSGLVNLGINPRIHTHNCIRAFFGEKTGFVTKRLEVVTSGLGWGTTRLAELTQGFL